MDTLHGAPMLGLNLGPASYPTVRSAGIVEGWNASAMMIDVPDGFRREIEPADDDTVVWIRSKTGAIRHFVDGLPACGVDASAGSFAVLHHAGRQSCVSEGAVQVARLSPKPDFLRSVAQQVQAPGDADDASKVCTRDLAFRQMADAYLARAFEDGDPPLAIEMDARALVMAIHLMRRGGDRATPETVSGPAKGGLAPKAKRRVEAYVEDHLAEAIRLQDLADAAGLSPFHFNRAFKRSLGLTPVGYVQDRRIARAKTLLKAPRTQVIEVAAAVGYQDPTHFAALFRRHTGMSPSRFRAG